MTTKKPKTPQDEKLQSHDVDLFEILNAIDKKDYTYYTSLTPEQQKKVALYVLLHWTSQVKGNSALQSYMVRSVDYNANTHFFNEQVQKHPSLCWMMLCASSPGLGKQFHQWIPSLSGKVSKFEEVPKEKEVRDYYEKLYPSTSSTHIYAMGEAFVTMQKKKVYLATNYPTMKRSDIELLAEMITDEEIEEFERAKGN